MKPMVLEPLTPPFPKWYNPNAYREYHAGILGHSIEDYAPFTDEVQKLIGLGVLSFTVIEQLINEVVEEDRNTTLTVPDSYIGMDENTIDVRSNRGT
ncbi:hypothetical protein CRYUN_Cryun04dG0124500 [Craigia yunnanensis]